jgi:EAL domain-containing protein (putative c-di-GMP-specific phosphodiesterase class I)
LGELGIERSRVVLELTERSLITDYDLFGRVVDHYRRQGYAIAIDDLGDGFAGLKMLAQIEPDYVKLARFLVADIDRAPVRQALVESIVSFCQRVGIEVIAEGIERQEELDYLTAVGIRLGQGYLLGRPAPQLVTALSHQLHEQGLPLQGRFVW